MKRFPNKHTHTHKLHIQLIPYDSFCFARASVPINPVFPHVYFNPTHLPHPSRGLSNLINAFNSIPYFDLIKTLQTLSLKYGERNKTKR